VGALAGVGGVVAVLALLAAFVGPWAISWVSSGKFVISAGMMAAITASAGVVALMCVTGPALVSKRGHAAYVTGWAVAAVLTVAMLWMPVELSARVALALLIAPAVGFLVHLVALMRAAWD
jgi:hypothetical protein